MSQDSEKDGSTGLNPNWVLLLIVAVGLGYGVWVFQQETAGLEPHWQVYVDTRELPEYRVNLWSDPHPPHTGDVEFTVQFDFVDFMNSTVSSAELILVSPDGTRMTHSLEEVRSDHRGTVYRTGAAFNRAGEWSVLIDMNYRGRSHQSDFDLRVSEGKTGKGRI
jgi:hypothetical protein